MLISLDLVQPTWLTRWRFVIVVKVSHITSYLAQFRECFNKDTLWLYQLISWSQICRRLSPRRVLQTHRPVWWSKKQTGTQFCGSKELQPWCYSLVERSGALSLSHCFRCWGTTFGSHSLMFDCCCWSPRSGWALKCSCSGSPRWGRACRRAHWEHCCWSCLGRRWPWCSWVDKQNKWGNSLRMKETKWMNYCL